jgi:hypothetical protein
VRAFFMDGCNLTAYNLASGDYNIYKKLSPTVCTCFLLVVFYKNKIEMKK